MLDEQDKAMKRSKDRTFQAEEQGMHSEGKRTSVRKGLWRQVVYEPQHTESNASSAPLLCLNAPYPAPFDRVFCRVRPTSPVA